VQSFESLYTISGEFVCGLESALVVDPRAKLVAIDGVRLRDARVALAFDELF
jgi:hypothetical protein